MKGSSKSPDQDGQGRPLGSNGSAGQGKPGKRSGLANGATRKLSVEPLEPRILLSATWVDADTSDAIPEPTAGDDIGIGSDFADVMDGHGGDDVLFGEGGDDLFQFQDAQDGDVVAVDGGDGHDTIDLSGYSVDNVTFGDGTLTVDQGGGNSFTIHHTQVESITFSDTTASVLTGDHAENGFSGSEVFVSGGEAFRIDVAGSGNVDWSFDADTGSLTVGDTHGTGHGTSLSINDLTGTDLNVEHVSIRTDLGALDSNVDIDTLSIANNRNIDAITVGNGIGSIGTLDYAYNVDSSAVINANVGVVEIGNNVECDVRLQFNGDVGQIDLVCYQVGDISVTGNLGSFQAGGVTGDITVGGDAGSITIQTPGSADDLAGNLIVQGNLGQLDVGDDITGSVTVSGDVGGISVGDRITKDITIGGDLDAFSVGGSFTGTLTADQVNGQFDLHDDGRSYSNEFESDTQVVYDGATHTLTANASVLQPIAVDDVVTTQEDTPVVTGNVLANDTAYNTNLVVNGSFENTLVLDGGWQVFSDGIAGWKTSNGPGIEVQSNAAGSALDGNQHVELDSHGSNYSQANSGMYQDIDTQEGDAYTLEFAYSPRPGRGAADNAIEVWWDGQLLDTITADGTGLSDTDWQHHSYEVTGGSDTTRLEFRAVGTGTTYGGYLDDVSVVGENTLEVTEHTQGSHGSVVYNGDGTFTYTPQGDFNGVDTFEYTVADGNGGFSTATVSVTVEAVDDPVPPPVDNSPPTEDEEDDSLWDGNENLAVLQTGGGPDEIEFNPPPELSADNSIGVADPLSVSLHAPSLDLFSEIIESPRYEPIDIQIPSDEARFEDVFEAGGDVLVPFIDPNDGADLQATAAGAGAEGDIPDTFLTQLWGLLRGAAGTTKATDEPDAPTNRTRGRS